MYMYIQYIYTHNKEGKESRQSKGERESRGCPISCLLRKVESSNVWISILQVWRARGRGATPTPASPLPSTGKGICDDPREIVLGGNDRMKGRSPFLFCPSETSPLCNRAARESYVRSICMTCACATCVSAVVLASRCPCPFSCCRSGGASGGGRSRRRPAR
jgi:hypothetical protein